MPYREPGNPNISHDEMLRRVTNEKLSEELVKLAAVITEHYKRGLTSTGEETLKAYERMAKVLKSRGI